MESGVRVTGVSSQFCDIGTEVGGCKGGEIGRPKKHSRLHTLESLTRAAGLIRNGNFNCLRLSNSDVGSPMMRVSA